MGSGGVEWSDVLVVPRNWGVEVRSCQVDQGEVQLYGALGQDRRLQWGKVIMLSKIRDVNVFTYVEQRPPA